MFQRFHAMRERREGGFTLIELLVVILIIAILAAIAIPIFLEQREKGWIAQMESALKNGATAAESYATGPGDGDYQGLTEPLLRAEGWRYADDVNVVAVNTNATGEQFCIQVAHDRDLGTEEPMAIASNQTSPDQGTCAAGVFSGAGP